MVQPIRLACVIAQAKNSDSESESDTEEAPAELVLCQPHKESHEADQTQANS